MWILAAEDRLYWLLPGRRYIVGRVQQKNVGQVDIPVHDDPSVSRKHLSLLVPPLLPRAVEHPSIRSELSVTDLNSRYGTKISGKSLAAGSAQLVPQVPDGMLSVCMGRDAKRLRLKWSLHVVTYLTGQSGEAHDTLFDYAVGIAERCDIRITSHLVAATNVLVVTGKSTSSLFYALVKQIPVVNTQYFEALQRCAEDCAQNGTTDRSILPKLDPFYADPAYRPNVLRQQALQGVELTIPDAAYATVMAPIVEAAGGTVCAEANLNLVATVEEAGLPTGAQYVLGSTVFNLIYSVRKMEDGDTGVKKRRPKRRNLLDIMTSQSTAPKTETEVAAKPAKKQKVPADEEPLFVNSQMSELEGPLEQLRVDSALQTSPPGNSSLPGSTTESPKILSPSPLESTKLTPRATPRATPEPQAEPANTKKRANRTSPPLQTKKARHSLAETQGPEGPPAEDTEPEILGGLVVVSKSVTIGRHQPVYAETPHPDTGRPNYKGFVPKGQTNASPRIPKPKLTETVGLPSPREANPKRGKKKAPQHSGSVGLVATEARPTVAVPNASCTLPASLQQSADDDDEFGFSFQ